MKQSKSTNQEEAESPALEPAASQPAEPDYKELYRRALADSENSRKRFEQERSQVAQYALQGFVEDLLPVIDNFDRAANHVPAEQQASPWVTGIQYIRKNLLDVLESYGVKEIPAQPGDPFDPDIHEALAAQPSQEYPDHSIIAVQNKGYRLHDRIVRPVQVIVSSGPEEGNSEDGSSPESADPSSTQPSNNL